MGLSADVARERIPLGRRQQALEACAGDGTRVAGVAAGDAGAAEPAGGAGAAGVARAARATVGAAAASDGAAHVRCAACRIHPGVALMIMT